MIYLDTSALVKLVTAEDESPALIDWLNDHADEHLATSMIGHIELIRAAGRAGTAATAAARYVTTMLDSLILTEAIVALAQTLPAAELRTLEAIHLATAHIHRQGVVALCAYDRRMIAAAKLLNLPVVSPRSPA